MQEYQHMKKNKKQVLKHKKVTMKILLKRMLNGNLLECILMMEYLD